MASSEQYDLIVVVSRFAGSMATLNFLEECNHLNKPGRVALVEAGKSDERCGASRWTMAYLRLDKDLDFDSDWIHEMRCVSEGQADESYCHKLAAEARSTAEYLVTHGVKLVHHDEKNVLLEFGTGQHFVYNFPAILPLQNTAVSKPSFSQHQKWCRYSVYAAGEITGLFVGGYPEPSGYFCFEVSDFWSCCWCWDCAELLEDDRDRSPRSMIELVLKS